MIPASSASASVSASVRDDQQVTEWALAARGGDREAVERFVRATHRDVWRFVAYLDADIQNADDLTQETYLRALERPGRDVLRAPAEIAPLTRVCRIAAAHWLSRI